MSRIGQILPEQRRKILFNDSQLFRTAADEQQKTFAGDIH